MIWDLGPAQGIVIGDHAAQSTESFSSSINLKAAECMVRFSTRIAESSSQPAATAEEIRIGSKTLLHAQNYSAAA